MEPEEKDPTLQLDPSPESVEDLTTKRHKLTTGQLIIFTYFWTVGGPFGIERYAVRTKFFVTEPSTVASGLVVLSIPSLVFSLSPSSGVFLRACCRLNFLS